MPYYSGGPGNDQLVGSTGADTLDGAGGNDYIDAGSGNYTTFGGTGNDTIFGWNDHDRLLGEAGDDRIYGENNNDTIDGGAGNDWIVGDGTGDIGKDVMAGGQGADTLQGGADNDQYIFTFNSDGQDWIYDSAGEYDTLSVSGVTNLSGLGFVRGSVFGVDSNDLFIYTNADAADGVLSEYIRLDDFWSGSAAGAGRIEYLNVGQTNYWFNDVVWGM